MCGSHYRSPSKEAHLHRPSIINNHLNMKETIYSAPPAVFMDIPFEIVPTNFRGASQQRYGREEPTQESNNSTKRKTQRRGRRLESLLCKKTKAEQENVLRQQKQCNGRKKQEKIFMLIYFMPTQVSTLNIKSLDITSSKNYDQDLGLGFDNYPV